MSEGLALVAVSFGLVAAIVWGVADFFGAKASQKFGGITTSFYVSCIAALLFAILYVLFFTEHTQFVASALLYAAGGGVLFAAALAAFYKGLELGPVSIVSPLGSLYPLVTTLFLVVLFGQSLSFVQTVGIVMVVGGAVVAAGIMQRVKGGQKVALGPLLALFAAVGWGVMWALMAQAIDQVGWQLATLVQSITSAIALGLLLPFIARGEKSFTPGAPQLRDYFVWGAGTLQIAGYLAVTWSIGMADNLAAVVVAVSSCYSVLTVLLAVHKLKERVAVGPLIGAFVGVAGIVVLSLG